MQQIKSFEKHLWQNMQETFFLKHAKFDCFSLQAKVRLSEFLM